MVRFCNGCKRAVDDLDKFCRSCGHDTSDSIDYYTYYKSSVKEDIDQKALTWFLRGKDIAIREEIRKLNEKVDSMYTKLFPPSVEELRGDLGKIFDKGEEELPEIIAEGKGKEKGEEKGEGTGKLPEINVEKKEEDGDEGTGKLPEINVEKKGEERKEEIIPPKEENDKLNMLLQEDEGQRQAVQYLINKYRGKDTGSNVNSGSGIAIVPEEDVVRIGRIRQKGKEKGEQYKMYGIAIHPYIPDILRNIEGSKDGMIRIKLSDVAKKMGEKFVDKKPATIYTGLKYTLFDHHIVVEMGSLKEIDPDTKENIKILKMRMKNPDDKSPLLEKRGDTDEENEGTEQ